MNTSGSRSATKSMESSALGDIPRRILVFLTAIAVFLYPTNAGIILADFEFAFPAPLTQAASQAVLVSTPAILPQFGSPENTSSLRLTFTNVRVAKITAYTSSPEETDDTPFETASGTPTRDGVIATNFLPFGTKVMIPSLFGNKVFVVEDRMHPRMTDGVDIWMPTKVQARHFGIQYAEIAVLD